MNHKYLMEILKEAESAAELLSNEIETSNDEAEHYHPSIEAIDIALSKDPNKILEQHEKLTIFQVNNFIARMTKDAQMRTESIQSVLSTIQKLIKEIQQDQSK